MSTLYFNTFRNEFQYDADLAPYITDANFPILAAYGSGGNPALLVNTVQFGDGYEQRGMAGIVGFRDSYTLIFEKKRDAVTLALRRFFLGQPKGKLYHRNVSDPFYMVLPAPFMSQEDMPRKFVVESFNVNTVEYGTTNTTVVIKDWFGA